MAEPLQHRLFDIGGALAMPGNSPELEAGQTDLEEAIERLNAELPPLTL